MNNWNKIPIGGIKFSEERAHFSVYRQHSEQAAINELLQRISDKQVNISFLCHMAQGALSRTSFCVSGKDAPLVSEIVSYSPSKKIDVTTHLQVGSITIFPHKNDVTLIAVIMSLMESLHYPVYSFSTSISALIINTQFKQLKNIAYHLTDIFELPQNHSPFQQEFQLLQPRTSMTP